MPRPQRELDPGGGPLVEFARELRELRASAGDPKFATMSRRTQRSKTALADAASGRHLPRWETVEDYVCACDADPVPWRARWERARVESSRPGGPAAGTADDGVEPAAEGLAPEEADDDPAPDTPAGDMPALDTPAPETPAADTPAADTPAGETPPVAPGPDPVSAAVGEGPTAPLATAGRGRRGFGLGMIVGALLGAAVVAGIAVVVTATARPPVTTQDLRVIEVQNKVAVGPDRLVEDSTPAYLSSVPIAYCAAPSRHCKVGGTEMASGATIVANCQVQGQRMVNFNLTEVASRANPYRADSQIWYRASFPDGRTGYLSEVYVDGENRGGLGLPTCGPVIDAAGRAPGGG